MNLQFFAGVALVALNPIGDGSLAVDSGISSCYNSDKAHQGGELHSHWTGCSHACQRACSVTLNCEYWTYSPTSTGNDCILHSKAAKQVTRIGSISGGKRCTEPISCVATNAFPEGKSILSETASQFSECQKKCKLDVNCRFAVFFIQDRWCELYGASAQLRAISTSSDRILGPRDCAQGWCFQYGSFAKCAEIKVIADISNPTSCQSECRKVPGCSEFSWNKSGDKKCYLHKAECERKYIKDLGAVTGLRKCGDYNSAICGEVGMDYYGNDIVRLTAKTVEECSELCFSNHKCEHFTANLKNKNCFLKNGVATNRRDKQASSVVSGPAVCHEHPPCFDVDVEYSGRVLKTTKSSNAKLCAQDCYATPKCQQWTWLTGNTCKLFYGEGNTSSKTKLGAVSSTVHCLYNPSYRA